MEKYVDRPIDRWTSRMPLWSGSREGQACGISLPWTRVTLLLSARLRESRSRMYSPPGVPSSSLVDSTQDPTGDIHGGAPPATRRIGPVRRLEMALHRPAVRGRVVAGGVRSAERHDFLLWRLRRQHLEDRGWWAVLALRVRWLSWQRDHRRLALADESKATLPPDHVPRGYRSLTISSKRFAAISNAASSAVVLRGLFARPAGTTSCLPFRAKAVRYTRHATPGAGSRPPRISSITCCRRCRCGSGCCPYRSGCAFFLHDDAVLQRVIVRRWAAGHTAGVSRSMPRCTSQAPTWPVGNGCCATVRARRSPSTICTPRTLSDAEHLVYDIAKPRPDGRRVLVLTPLELIDKVAALRPGARTAAVVGRRGGASGGQRSALGGDRPTTTRDRIRSAPDLVTSSCRHTLGPLASAARRRAGLAGGDDPWPAITLRCARQERNFWVRADGDARLTRVHHPPILAAGPLNSLSFP